MEHKSFTHPFFKDAFDTPSPWWMYLFGLMVIILFSIIGQIPALVVAMLGAKKTDPTGAGALITEFQSSADWSVLGIDLNLGLALLLLSFAVGIIGIIIAVNMLGRSIKSLITPSRKINFSKIAFGFFLWLFISLLAEGIAYVLHPSDYIWNFEWKPFVILVLICVSLLPFQTSFEELALRGYLMQGLGRWLRYPLPALILSSVLFASLHIMNPEVVRYGRWTMLTYYSIAGIFLGVMTVFDNSLELALGVHFATNFTSALFISYEGAALQTPALFKMMRTDIEMMTGSFVVLAGIFLFICAIKYKWPDPSYLIKKINYHHENVT